MSTTIPATPANLQLAISGMPELTNSMKPGGLYVMMAATPSARFPILAASIGDALSQEREVNVVVQANPGQFLERMVSLVQIDAPALMVAQRLGVFEMQEEFRKKMFRLGAERFVAELDQLEIGEDSYLLVDQADELLALHDLALALDQVDILGRWLEKRRVTALLIFTRANSTHAGTINALMDNLTGIFHLAGDRDGLSLTFDYWQSPEGTIAARSFRLSTLESGMYTASSRVMGEAAAPVVSGAAPEIDAAPASDEPQRYFYIDPALASVASSVPGIWQRVDTLVGMLHATQKTRAPTCLLSFERGTGVRQLAEAVHTLRLSLGRRARIVVQEKGVSLRYQNEALLLRLGVNLVVHRDVPLERVPLLLDSLNGQLFSRDVDINFEAALASVLPTRVRGYLTPQRFAREAATLLEQAQPLQLPCALVSGVPRIEVAELIASCSLSRPGDLITFDGERVLIFFNACPQAALLRTVERAVGRPSDEVFEATQFLTGGDEIAAIASQLAQRAAEAEMPDFSHLAKVEEVEEAAPAEPAPAHGTEPPPAQHTAHAPLHIPAHSSVPTLELARVAQLARPAAPPHIAPVPVPGAALVQDLPAPAATSPAGPRFSYDGERKLHLVGRQAAPRATRSQREGQQV